ncbi:MAG: 3'-5' exonuclease [Alphaproteobacteria bacterium]|nr:3'-5' exonuclease [Alphaproteobacteria bacterium]
MARLLILDTETGGIDPAIHPILTLGCVIWEDGALGAEFEVMIAEPNPTLDEQALKINRIDPKAHFATAMPPLDAMRAFHTFLKQHFLATGKDRIPLAGHNINFDVGFVRRLCRLTGFYYDEIFSHRVLDTAGIIRFLNLAGKLSLPGAGSTEAFAHFGIAIKPDVRHTALADAKATGVLLTKLVDIVR